MRSVLVTGVSTGIGKAIAEELLNAEYIVIGSVRNLDDGNQLKEKYSNLFFRNFSLFGASVCILIAISSIYRYGDTSTALIISTINKGVTLK